MTARWIEIEAERVLYLDRGLTTVLVDRSHPGPVTMVVKLSAANLEKIARVTAQSE